MKRVFFDECGNTGQNLLDDADPIFVLASCSLQPTEEQQALAHFHQFKGPELKFARLRKTPAGQRAVLTFLRSAEVTVNKVSAVLFHKTFMVVSKYCDLVLEPSFRSTGVDFYRRGLNIATANLLTTIMPVLLNRTTWANFLAQFVRVVRERDPIVFSEWRRSAELIFAHFEHTDPKAADFFAPVLLLKDCSALFETFGDDELDPLVPAYNVLVDHWGKVLASEYEVIADQSKVLAKARKHFLALSNPNLKQFSAGYDRRKIEFPLRASDIIGVDSTAHKQVQLADIVGGALASAAKARTRGPLQEGTFAGEVFEICFAKHIIVDALWPSHELDPKELGTNVDPEPNEIDAATYASMILRGHAATTRPMAEPLDSAFMNTKDFIRLGIPLGEATRRATGFVTSFILAGGDKTRLEEEMKNIIANPSAFVRDELRGELAKALLNAPPPPRAEPVKYRHWGEGLEHEAVMQMEKACLLPVAVAGALMPDAHVGYGLPIGGVLATENAVIPYAVGVDIACRMKMTVLDVPIRELERHPERLTRAIEAETRFGVGATFKNRRSHEVMDAGWEVSPVTKQNKDRAWSQLGTSGSGNHFVEFGLFTSHGQIHGLEAGTYLALLSHSGSRGTGAAVCDHYSKLAFSRFPDLPSELKRLAWLSLDSQEGQEYWAAMELMGRYAAANHALIHKHVAANLGAEVLLDLENHHNFAWKEKHVINGVEKEVIVHRKGATPAGQGVLGIIPGSMASPGFVVSGKGNAESLNSASHGAGRVMSRTQATKTFEWKKVNAFLREKGVTLISAGLDEVPMVYKNIHEVMAAQKDLVTILGQFDPKLVKMAPHGGRAED